MTSERVWPVKADGTPKDVADLTSNERQNWAQWQLHRKRAKYAFLRNVVVLRHRCPEGYCEMCDNPDDRG